MGQVSESTKIFWAEKLLEILQENFKTPEAIGALARAIAKQNALWEQEPTNYDFNNPDPFYDMRDKLQYCAAQLYEFADEQRESREQKAWREWKWRNQHGG